VKARGSVTVARLWPEPAGWKEENWASFELEAVLHAADGQTDTYVSQNRFRGKRRAVVNVLELCSMYSDLDYYKAPELRDLSPEAVLEKVLERLRDEGIPGPSLALSSGRGLQAVWAHKPVGRKEMPTWNAAQDRIYRVLGPMRADGSQRHAASVLRLAGTTNSKNGATVRVLADAAAERYRFEDLAEALVKNAPEEEQQQEEDADLFSIAVHRAAKGLRNHPQGWSDVSLWEGRLTDLQHLRRMRYGSGVMEDHRDRWLFIATTAISWLVLPEVLEVEVMSLAEEAGGWDTRRARSDLGQVLKRARRAQAGEKIQFKGRLWDPRHHFRNETIIEYLEITPEEEREMVVTISPEEERRRKRLRDRAYQEKRRRGAGMEPRSERNRKRNALMLKKAATARQLKKCGVPTEDIAARMKTSTRTVQRWLEVTPS